MAQALRLSPVRGLGLLAGGLLAFALIQALVDRPVVPTSDAAAPAREVWGPPDYAAALEVLDRDIAREQARVAADPAAWMPQESLAMVYHARGQLTGSHADHAVALDAADAARAGAPAIGGPVLARAIVSLSMHRNAVAAEEVARIERFAIAPQPADLAEAEAIRGDVALYAGRYAEALGHYQAADGAARSPGSLVRLADWHRHMGDFDQARSLLEAGLADKAGITPWMRAGYLLQLGAVDLQSGDWPDAERRFADADAAFPGWWLVKAHLGQMAAVRGDFIAAEALYLEAQRGGERPSVMDALAALYHAMGKSDEAAALEARTSALWAQRVASHPEAYADHAFEAALRDGDKARAWQLAALNYRSRPYGDGRIGLARAAAARGRHASARAILEELHRTGWRSTEQYRVMDEVCTVLGDKECAQGAKRRALAISPQAYHPRAGLLAFGNH